MIDKLDALEKRNEQLINIINGLESKGEHAYDEKQEFHENKLEMIRLIKTGDKRNCITAKELIQRVKNRPPAIRYATGINALDSELNGGFAIGSLVILGGGSFVGKTHITLEILTNISKYNKAVFFNFEMGDTRIASRLVKMKLSDEQLQNLEIDEDSRNLKDLENEIILHAHKGIKFFVIDSKMKIDITDNISQHEKSSKVTHVLSRLSQKYEVIIFLINQISEDNQKSGYFSFKGSGDQLYDADYAMFYTKDENGIRHLNCIKNRIDEKEFAIELRLVNNRTVGINEPYQKETEIAYQVESISAPVI